jgi:lysophospholipase L1-like esterase
VLLSEAAFRAVKRVVCVTAGAKPFQPHPRYGWTHEPGAEGWTNGCIGRAFEWRAFSRMNADGLRDREYPRTRTPGVTRILLLGDSFVEGLQVPLERTMPSLMEARLRETRPTPRVEVLNLGQSGFGTTDEYLRFEHFGKAFSPDVVVVAVCVGNDVRNNSRTLNTESMTYYYVLGADGQLVLDSSLPDAYAKRPAFQRAFQAVKRHSYLASLVAERVYLLRLAKAARDSNARLEAAGAVGSGVLAPIDDLNVFVDDPPRVWQEAWEVTQAVLLKFRDGATAAGARFVVMTIPAAEQIDEAARAETERRVGRKLDWDHADTVLVPFAQANAIPILPLAPVFRATYARTGEPLYGFGGGVNNGHWNEKGHALAATTLLDFLEREGLLDD